MSKRDRKTYKTREIVVRGRILVKKNLVGWPLTP